VFQVGVVGAVQRFDSLFGQLDLLHSADGSSGSRLQAPGSGPRASGFSLRHDAAAIRAGGVRRGRPSGRPDRPVVRRPKPAAQVISSNAAP
jgi:hypothetical protein